MDGLDLALVWTRALEALPGDLPPQHRAWLAMTRPLALVEDTALLATPNEFAKDVLENRLRPLITQVLSNQLGRDIRVAVTVQPDQQPPTDRPLPAEPESDHEQAPRAYSPEPTGYTGQTLRGPHADPRPYSPEQYAESQYAAERYAGGQQYGNEQYGNEPVRRNDQYSGRRYDPYGATTARTSSPAAARPTPRASATRSSPPPGRPPARRLAAAPLRPHREQERRRALGAPQPQVRLRHLRHRHQQPLRPRGGGRRGRGAGQRLQPAVHLRRVRPGQDPPAARHRPLRAEPVQRRAGALRQLRGVHQRLHQPDPRRQGRGLPPALPRHGLPAGRRHPVPGEQGADAGGVLPHLQHPAQRQQADRDLQRPGAQAADDAGGPAAQPVRVGPDHRRPAARAGDPHRDPAQEGVQERLRSRRRGAGVHRQQGLRPTSASSRAR